MKSIHSTVAELRDSPLLSGRYVPPMVILLVTILAYGLQITRLGFYWDDWAFVARFQTQGIFNTIFYGGTRQLGVFALMPGFLLAGDSPLLWHIYSLLLRWLVSMLFWWVLNNLWSGQKTSITLMAALFAVHPAFSQQSIAVVYSLQFVNYAIFLISIGLMIKTQKNTGHKLVWLVLALLSQSLHLFIVEYYVGLELIRPLVLLLLLDQQRLIFRLKSAFLRWLPYLLVLVIYAVWRSGVFGGGFDTYEYKTIGALWRADPSAALVEIIEYGLKDILVLLFNTWQVTLSPAIVDLSQPYNFFSIGMAVLVAFGLYFFLTGKYFDAEISEETQAGRFFPQAALLGSWAVLVSFVPAWFVRRHIVEPGNFGDRFALAGLFGASILLVAVAQFFAGRRGRGVFLNALFIGLAVGAQMRFANNYRWDWERQLRTYWQVIWRAPALRSGTVLVGYDAISSTTVNYVGGFAFDILYRANQSFHQPSASIVPPVWFVNYPKTTISANLEKFQAGEWVYQDEFDNISAIVRRDNIVAVDYAEGRCVKIITPDDLLNRNLPDYFRPVAGLSNPGLIITTMKNPPLPAQRIFGAAPDKNWCYFFQKAELARSLGDWGAVIAYEKEAVSAGLEPLNAYEWFPFIEAYAMQADWTLAQKRTAQAYKALPKTQEGLCQIWLRVGNVHSPVNQDDFTSAFSLVNEQLHCR